MVAGYNLKQIQDYRGHADLVTTGRYIKNLPVPRGTTERAKLEADLAQEIGDIWARKVGHKIGHTCQARCRS
jgi:hypothetical protein